MRAIVIDPHKRTVSETTFDTSRGLLGLIHELKAAIGNRPISRTALAPGVDLWVDDEGFLDEAVPQSTQAYFLLLDGDGDLTPFAGRGVLIGIDAAGETVALPDRVTVEAVQRITVYADDAWAFERVIATGHVARPQSSITTFDRDGAPTVDVTWEWKCPERPAAA
jgi:hypothetical protein